MPQQDAFDSTPATPTTPAPTQDAFDQPTPQAASAAAGQQDAFDQTPTPTEPPKPAIPAGMLMGSDGKLHSIPNDYLSKLEDKVSSGASGVEQGAGDVWDAIKGMVTHPINTAATALGGVPVNEAAVKPSYILSVPVNPVIVKAFVETVLDTVATFTVVAGEETQLIFPE